MKKYNKKSLAAGALLGAAVVMSGVAFAANDTAGDVKNEMRFNKEQRQENTEAKAAMDAGDYDAFVAATSDRKGPEVTEEKFAKMVALNIAKEAGDDAKVAELKAEMKSEREVKRAEREVKREARKAAIEAGDYAALQAMKGDREDRPEVTEAAFTKMTQLHAAKAAGDDETVSEIKAELKELGFEKKDDKKGERKGDR